MAIRNPWAPSECCSSLNKTALVNDGLRKERRIRILLRTLPGLHFPASELLCKCVLWILPLKSHHRMPDGAIQDVLRCRIRLVEIHCR